MDKAKSACQMAIFTKVLGRTGLDTDMASASLKVVHFTKENGEKTSHTDKEFCLVGLMRLLRHGLRRGL